MKKKFIPLLLAALLPLTACTPADNNPAHPITNPTSATAPAPAETTSTAPTETAESTEQPQPTETPAPTSETAPETEAPTEPATTLPEGIAFPYVLEDGKLEIDSVFQYSGVNVDCNMEDGTDVGAIVLKNLSDTCLESLDLTVTLSDGTVLSFDIRQIPAGAEVWAFEKNNTRFNMESCMGISAKAVFHEDGILGVNLTAETEGYQVTLANTGSTPLHGVTLYCHPILDGILFGGTAYSYEPGELAPGSSTDVLCIECFMGEAAACWADVSN